jgi:hypothetical protein
LKDCMFDKANSIYQTRINDGISSVEKCKKTS